MENASDSSFDITKFSSYSEVEGQYTDSFIKGSRCVKISEDAESVTVAISSSYRDKNEIIGKVHYPKNIESLVVDDSDFAEFIGNFVERQAVGEDSGERHGGEFRLEDINSGAPVVNMINAICLEAIRRNASDIHIQTSRSGIAVRLRMDGVLHTVRRLDRSVSDNLVSRIKVMSGLNVMENRLCQDGRMSVNAGGRSLDFRVSVVPAVDGQNIVLRLFNDCSKELSLEQLGFSDEKLAAMASALGLPFGLILVTGPTGSGKTTTLHAMLEKMDIEHLKVVTIEDPVEKVMDGIEQIQVNDEIGLTFSSVLRRILRQDPDVIMVGEIRDAETAELAVRSALTGHLILSTLHTNDCVSAIARLEDLGVEPYMVAGVLRTSIAQRLVRKVCPFCGGSGCGECGSTGYKGRTAVSEILMVDDAISKMIERRAPDSEIRSYLRERGFSSLREDAASKVEMGISTKEELVREGLA